MKIKLIFLFLFISFPLFAANKKVLILNNTHNTVVKESALINQLCTRYFSRSEISFNSQSLVGFDINALFQESHILAKKTCQNSNYSYLIIPASLMMGNNLIRARLMVYDLENDEFSTIYDKVISSLDADEYVQNNIVLVFDTLGFGNMGIVNFPEKDYGFNAYIDGQSFEDKGILEEGEHTLEITAEGYKPYKKAINIKPQERNLIDFELEREQYSDLLISTDGLMYNANSSDIGVFTLPFYIDEYSTPSSLSFSYPGFETKYMSLTSDIKNINVSLKPSFLANDNWTKLAVNDFYKSITFTLSAFALDLVSRSFLNKYSDSDFFRAMQTTFSNMAYFSLGIVFIKMVDYYFSSVYAFK